MVTTSFTAAALVVLTSGTVSNVPTWQKDYATAMSAAVAQQKPMAVFIGQGEAGYAKLVAGGQIPAAANAVLNSEYVAVYVNTETATGQALAGAFEMQAGLVLSTRGGAKQALRLPGTVTQTDLTGLLTAYSGNTVAAPVVTTSAPAYGHVAPAHYAPAHYGAPAGYAPAYRFAAPARGGCANGRCGR